MSSKTAPSLSSLGMIFGCKLRGSGTSRYKKLLEVASKARLKDCRLLLSPLHEYLLLFGDIETDIKIVPKTNNIIIFMSSTFDDTKFEQDALLRNVFPFLREFCNVLGMNFDVVSMRWGVRSRASNDHRTADLCMKQLQKCVEESASTAYITLQSHRYGARIFPSVILRDEFEQMLSYLRDVKKKSEDELAVLKQPFWLLDEMSLPQVYQLQPVSTLPHCEAYLLTDDDKLQSRLNPDFRDQGRDDARKAAERQWWTYWETMQQILREGSETLDESARRKYFISVTEAEVTRGILENERALSQTYLFERTITGIEEALRNDPETVGAYKDVLWAPKAAQGLPKQKDQEAENLLEDLKRRVREKLDATQKIGRIKESTVPWVGGGKLNKANDKEPAEWQGHVQSFCDQFVDAVCHPLLGGEFVRPLEDHSLMSEIVSQRDMVLEKLRCPGFARADVIEKILLYVTSPSNRRTLVLHGLSGTGKTWIMCKAVEVIRKQCPNAVIINRLLGTSSDTSDAWRLIRNVTQHIAHAYSKAFLDIHSSRTDTTKGKSSNNLRRLSASKIHERGLYRTLTRDNESAAATTVSAVTTASTMTSQETRSALEEQEEEEEDQAIEAFEDVFSQWGSASEQFASGAAFAKVSETENAPMLVLFLDSIDQLQDLHGALDDLGAWLPGVKRDLPPNVKVVVSTLPQDDGHHILNELENHIDNDENFVEVAPLQVSEADAAIDTIIANRPADGLILPTKRILSAERKALLVELFEKDGSPLFLRVAADIVCRWPSYAAKEKTEDVLRAAAATGVQGLVNLVFSSLEETHGKLLVSRILGLLTASKEGLSEAEIDDLMSNDDEVLDDVYEWWVPPIRRLPPMLIQRVVDDLQGFLIKRGSGGLEVLYWYHRQFRETAFKRYLSKAEDFQRSHEALVRYFNGKALTGRSIDRQPLRRVHYSPLENDPEIDQDGRNLLRNDHHWHLAMAGPVNVRKCLQLPHSLSALGDVGLERCADLLTDIGFLSAMADAHLVPDIIELYILLKKRIDKVKQPAVHDRVKVYWRWVNSYKHQWRSKQISVMQSALFMPDHTTVYRDAMTILRVVKAAPSREDREHFQLSMGFLVRWNVGKPQFMDPCIMTLEGHIDRVTCTAYSPDERMLVSGSGQRDKTIRLWDSETGVHLLTLDGHSAEVSSVAFDPLNTDRVASASSDGTIKLWQLSTKKCIATLRGHSPGHAVYISFNPRRPELISGSADATVRVWNLESHECTEKLDTLDLDGEEQSVNAIEYVPRNGADGYAFTAGGFVFIKMMDDHVPNRLKGRSDCLIPSIAFAPFGDKLAVAPDEKDPVRILDLSGTCTATFEARCENYPFVAFSPDGAFLACAYEDKYVKIYDLSNGSCKKMLDGHGEGYITALTYSPVTGDTLATAGSNRVVKIWEAKESVDIRNVGVGHNHRVKTIKCSPNGLLVATGSHDHKLIVWDSEAGTVIHSIDAIRGAVVFSVDFSPDNSMVACGTSDGWAQVFSVADGELLHELNNSSVDVSCVVFSPNGKQLATSSGEGITIWDVSVSEQDEREDQSDRVIRFFEGHTEPVTCLVFSPDGSKVASSSLDGTARLWSINEKEGPTVLDAQHELHSVSYLPQPPSVEFDFIAVGCADRTIRIFNATESACVLAIEGHEAAVSTVCTSIDGGYLFSFSESNKLCKIWQLTFTGDEITCTCRATMTLSGTSITAMSLVSVPGSSAAEWLAGWDGDALSFALDDDSPIGGIAIGSNDENTLSTKSATFTNKQLEYVLTFGDITGCINVFRSVLSF